MSSFHSHDMSSNTASRVSLSLLSCLPDVLFTFRESPVFTLSGFSCFSSFQSFLSLFPFPFCPSRCPYRPLQDHTAYTAEDHFICVIFSTNATSSLPLLSLRFLAFLHFSDLVHDFLQAGKILSRIPKSLPWQRVRDAFLSNLRSFASPVPDLTYRKSF